MFGTSRDAQMKLMPSGTSWKRFGERKGLAASMDSKIIENKIGQLYANYGGNEKGEGAGAYTFALTDEKGTVLVGDEAKPLPLNGKVYYPNAAGVFKVFDGEFLDMKVKIQEEEEQTVNDTLRKCMVSNEVATMLLGDAYTTNKDPTKGLAGMSDDLKAANCDVDFLNSLSKESVIFSTGVSKLRYIVKRNPVIIDNSATSKSIAEHGID